MAITTNMDTWISTYDIPESPESSVEMNVRLHVTEFSDGYTQRIPFGTNNVRRVYTFVTRLLTSTQASYMRQFLNEYSQGERITKNTSPTDGVSRYWWIQSWEEALDGPIHYSFSAVLIEDR